ncbi:hypothetical protein [Methylobacterium iners]|uniref:Uncharacterized protein n=1 Tax=Methylobacterium iners TaxID=418707 RepID=A0ABQ4RU31_9HYPH|nr:hypothetical protein [Methylobacterium iners]GJD94306.1 hypothetical protein OCOJLMKI_1508 [Methylobacterium iners]
MIRSRSLVLLLSGLALLDAGSAAGQTPAEAPVTETAPLAKRPPVRRKPPPAPPQPMAATAPLANPKTPELAVVCDAKAARYEDAQGMAVWVTRSGAITIDNPLRPLTPDTTRVLQVIIRDRVATAYGPDLLGLRRGSAPATLEATTGGPIRWDGELTILPDPLTIVSETGEPLAQLPFKECGVAPATRPEPTVAAKKPPAAKPARSQGAPRPGDEPKAPPGLQVPQGAIAQ